jgi:hypothetical protein
MQKLEVKKEKSDFFFSVLSSERRERVVRKSGFPFFTSAFCLLPSAFLLAGEDLVGAEEEGNFCLGILFAV